MNRRSETLTVITSHDPQFENPCTIGRYNDIPEKVNRGDILIVHD